MAEASEGFNLSGFLNDVGSAVQGGATDWLKGEIKNRTGGVTTSQPDSTLAYQAQMKELYEKNSKMILLVVGGLILVGLVYFLKKGFKRGRK
jgi:hypothetical protein